MSNKRVNPFKLKLHLLECEADEKDKKISDLEAKLAELQKPKEIRFNGFVIDCNYDEARKVLQEDILKMWEENKKLKESEELSNYAKCILKNKKLEEDLELSEKCCVEYEQEMQKLKQQLAEMTKKYELASCPTGGLVDRVRNLELQLAEKEKEIEKYRNMNMIVVGGRSQDKKHFMQVKIKELQNQKAIEQLEKVKELLNTDFESIISWIDPYEDGECLTSMTYNHNNTIKIIDNQINELKGEE